MMIDEPPPPKPPIAVVPVDDGQGTRALGLTQKLRRAGLAVDLGYSGNLGKRMKRANKIKARAAVLLGEDELARDAASVRDMETGEQEEVPLASLEEHLRRYR